MNNFQKVKIAELGKIITGKTPKTSDKNNFGGNTFFLTPSDNMNEKYIYKTKRYVSDKGKSTLKNIILPKDSICVSCIGSDLGKVVLTTGETITNQQINSIIVDSSKFDVNYIYYSATILGKILNYHSKTSTAVPIINKTKFSNYTISCPNLPTQKKIASILSTLDDKIELNNKINKNLEEMAQAIFKSWFVDFEPWGGEMPDDWEYGTLGDICNCKLGGTPSRNKKEFWGGEISWINSGKVNEFRIIEDSEKITKLGLQKSSTKLLPKNTIVIAITGATLGQISLLEIQSCANQSVVGIIPNKNIPYEYIFPYLKTNINQLTSHQTGGAQQHINKQNIENFNILVPEKEILHKYQKTVSSIYNKITINCFENKNLTNLRDTLLPKLMSGELDVSNLEI